MFSASLGSLSKERHPAMTYLIGNSLASLSNVRPESHLLIFTGREAHFLDQLLSNGVRLPVLLELELNKKCAQAQELELLLAHLEVLLWR